MMSLKSSINICEVKRIASFADNYRFLWTLFGRDLTENSRNVKHIGFGPLMISVREWRKPKYEWPNDFLPFYWQKLEKPEAHLATGDQVKDLEIEDTNALILGAEYSEALKTAPEVVRRQFTLNFANRKEVVAYQRYQLMKKMARHPGDEKSHEARIIDMTVKIRNNLYHFYNKYSGDERRRIRQNAMKNKRDKYLKQLYYQDYDRFKAITEKLQISFTATPLGMSNPPYERNYELSRLTKEYCDQIKGEKIKAYREKLKAQQQEFIKEKEEVEKWLEEQEKYVGIDNKSKFKK